MCRTPGHFHARRVSPSEMAERLREDGMATAREADPSYGVRFLEAVSRLPRGTRLTSEMVTAEVGLPPNGSEGAVGAWMSAAAKRGLIRRVGFTKAVRPNQHSTIISEWERR